MTPVAVIMVLVGGGGLLLAALTTVGERRRGGGRALAAAAGLAFPPTWIAWYVRDQVPSGTAAAATTRTLQP